MSFRLMCVTAHPDDESAGFGGALVMAHDLGVETSVICLTDGQAATHRGETSSAEELAAQRRAEFEAAGEILGVTRGEVMHYPDGALNKVDFYELTGVLVRRMREWRPQVVLTFGSEGGVNLHRDHMIAALAATAAFHFAGRAAHYPQQLSDGLTTYAPQKLYYLRSPFVHGKPENELATAAQTPHSLELELGEQRHKKLAAFMKHESQMQLFSRVRDAFEQHGGVERYLLIASRIPQAVGEDNALFAGVVDE